MGRRLQKVKDILKRFKDDFRPFAPKCHYCGKRVWVFQHLLGQTDERGNDLWYHEKCVERVTIYKLAVERGLIG